RISERISFIKDLVKRLRYDMIFRLDCGFLVSDTILSEAAYSRMITIISESNVLEEGQEILIHQSITRGFITDDTVGIGATHFETKDQRHPKEEQPKIEPKKRGRKSKEEREQWMIEKAEREANLPLFEKKIEDQLDVPLAELRSEIPEDPQWGVKKNSEGKNVFWYGYKAHLAVGSTSQYILQFSSGNLNDGKAAIPLLKGIHE